MIETETKRERERQRERERKREREIESTWKGNNAKKEDKDTHI